MSVPIAYMHQGNCHIYSVKLLDPDHSFCSVFGDSGVGTGYILSTHLSVLERVLTWLSV